MTDYTKLSPELKKKLEQSYLKELEAHVKGTSLLSSRVK